MAAAQPVRSGIDFSAFRDPKLARELIDRIHELVGNRSINLMEVCGTHTVSIGRYGFRSIMPTGLKLLSGPGCPVCVTANRDIDHAIALSNMDGAIITTFGDMMRVPGSSTSLAAQKAAGRDIRIVYSPLDALDIAEQNPERPVIFMGVGFETTTPTIAAAILEPTRAGSRTSRSTVLTRPRRRLCVRSPTTPRRPSTALSCLVTSLPSQAWHPLVFGRRVQYPGRSHRI